MAEHRICFSVADEFGGEIKFETRLNVSYEDMVKSINKDRLAETLCLSASGYNSEDIKFITPEEYEKEFGEGDNG